MRDKIDWVRFCKDYHVRSSGIRSGVWVMIDCPFCHDNGKFHGAVHRHSGAYHCWKCGKHSMFDFVSTVTGCAPTAGEVYKILDEYKTERDYYPTYNETANEAVTLVKGRKMPGTFPLGIGCRQYLIKRGFNPDYMEAKYGLKDGGMAGPWAWRLMIPFYFNSELYCWQGRHIGNNKIRYRSSSLKEAGNIKDIVYNIDNCHRNKVIAVEGVFDAWRFGDDCVALAGISVTDKQLALLAERFEEVYLLFDWGEKTAQERARDCQRKLTNLGITAYVLNMQGTKAEDPGTLSAYEVKEIKKIVFGDGVYETPWLLEER